jgi:hypothetical protein
MRIKYVKYTRIILVLLEDQKGGSEGWCSSGSNLSLKLLWENSMDLVVTFNDSVLPLMGFPSRRKGRALNSRV